MLPARASAPALVTWGLACLLVTGATGQAASDAPPPLPPPAARPVDFARDIKPLLEDRCLRCHGPQKKRGGLRLDTREGLLAEGDDGPLVKLGDSATSPLVHLVAAADPLDRMPPKDEGKSLDAREIAALRRWIDDGAVWPAGVALAAQGQKAHWAFVPPVRPTVPTEAGAGWAQNPIDHFVAQRLQAEGLTPSPPADRVTLLRRLSLDLVGLPPTVEAVDSFVADQRPDAIARAISRLLASPHHGERWGRHWLDAARYADSDGFEKDKPRSMWFYRDWVIDALNRDLPYDRFIIEQLAGDLLPGATQAQLVATGYLRNSMINEEGGVDPEQFRVEALFDRMDALGKGVLGLTTACAQCHSHKFDPISQEEYYRLLAFLNNDDEAQIAVYTPPAERERKKLLAAIERSERRLQHEPGVAAQMARWELTTKQGLPRWQVLQAPFIDDSTGGQKYVMKPDGSYIAQGYAPTKHNAQVVIETSSPRIGAFQLELLTDPNLPMGGPGRSLWGTGALTEFTVEASPRGQPSAKQKIRFARASADFEHDERPLEANFNDKSNRRRVTGPIAFAIDGKEETAWDTNAGPGRRNVARKAVFVPEAPIENPGGTLLTITLSQRHGGWNSDDLMSNNLGRFRLSITDRQDVSADPVPREARLAMDKPRQARSAAERRTIFAHYRTTVPAWREQNVAIDKLWARHPEGVSALVLRQRPEPRITHLLERGDFLKPARPVAPGVPAALNPWPEGAPRNRLGLARWLTDRRAPTTARVIANRLWQRYFGNGLFATLEDIGTQAPPPSHPELLDWLAVELMDSGWRLKHLHELIVSSATYQQSSRVTPPLRERDPGNQLLARGPRVRVEGEIVRDIALASSGLLDRTMGGPSVMPPAPAFLFEPPVSYAPFPWVVATGPSRYRRSVYIYRRRSTPFPALQAFDTPAGDVSCVRRSLSNTPLAALVTLNEETQMAAARALGRLMITEAKDAVPRISYGFRRVLSRAPAAAELQALQGLLARQRRRLEQGWAGAWQIAGGADEPPSDIPAGSTPVELAAYTIVARTLLNLDETITKE